MSTRQSKNKSSGELVSQAAFARDHHLSLHRLKRLIAEGLPRRHSKIPLADGEAWLRDNVDPARKDHWNGRSSASLNELRREREQIKIEEGHLALKKAKGEIVERAVVRRFLVERATFERDDWMGWVSAASARLAAAFGLDTGKVFKFLDSEVRDQLLRLSKKEMRDDVAR